MAKQKKKYSRKELCAAPGRKLSDPARRALCEAAERRKKHDPAQSRAKDCQDQRLEPTRYGDWESDGKCSDF